MTKESGFWQTVKGHLSAYGAFVRIEDRAGQGAPDVAYATNWARRASGWIELKVVPRWPLSARGKVRVKVEPGQPEWHERWAAAGGLSFVFLKVGRDVLVLPGVALRELAGPVDPARLRAMDLARGHGSGRFPRAEAMLLLTGATLA